MIVKLKGCPLCGGKPFYMYPNIDIRQPEIIMCLDCGLEIMGEYKPELVDIWNNRVDNVNEFEIGYCEKVLK